MRPVYTVLIVVLVSVCFGVCFVWMWSPLVYAFVLQSSLVLRRQSAIFNLWQNETLVKYQSVFFFNITNGDEFLSGEKMTVEEIGPVTYKVNWEKKNFEWIDKDSLFYTRIKKVDLVNDMPNVDEDSIIYTINISALEKISKRRNKHNLTCKDNLIIKTTIKQILFDTDGIATPDWVKRLNGPIEDNFTVITGESNLEHLNFVKTWNGKEAVVSMTDDVDHVYGMGLELGFPSSSAKLDYVLFDPDVCRSFKLPRLYAVEVGEISAIRFEDSSGTNILHDECKLCRLSRSQNYCPELPLLLSPPNFYASGYSLKPSQNKMSPSRSNYFLSIEPNTGLTIEFGLRYQLNIQLPENFNCSNYSKIVGGIYPILWADITGSNSKQSDKFLYHYVNLPGMLFHSLASDILFFFLFVSTIACVSVYMWKTNDKPSEGGRLVADVVRNYASCSNVNTVSTICSVEDEICLKESSLLPIQLPSKIEAGQKIHQL